jgi:streptogramin lyase
MRFAPALLLLCVPLPACGDSGGATDSGASTTAGPTVPTTTTTPTPTDPGVTSSETGVSGTESASGTSTGGTASSSGSTTEDLKFDLGVMPDIPGSGCGGDTGGGNTPEFSYIWIANSSQGTISKIDTQTLAEQGRYIVRPDSAGSPSRTSVNLSGDVAVANRLGGVTKVYADPADCQDTNGMPGIQTSTDTNFLPWGVEECIAWYTPFAFTTQRPVAWAPGTLNLATCEYENEKLWTAGGQNNVADSLTIHRLDGQTGAVEATVAMPDVFHGYFGAYGGAVNAAGDFWFVTYDLPSTLVRVDAQTLAYEKVTVPNGLCPYGFTVDSKGRPWTGSFCQASARYTPETGTWDQFPILGYGLQQDAEGRMWIADYSLPGTRAIDVETLQVLSTIALPSGSVKGVSIDFYGYVWIVDMSQSAFRVDPETQMFQSYDGLFGPYTYSDMTGWGLSNVANPQG